MGSPQVSSAADLPLSVQDSSQFDEDLEEQFGILAKSAAEEAARALGDKAGREHLATSQNLFFCLQAKRRDASWQLACDDYRPLISDSIETPAEEEVETCERPIPEESSAACRTTSKNASSASVAFCVSKVEQKIARLRRRMTAGAQDQATEALLT